MPDSTHDSTTLEIGPDEAAIAFRADGTADVRIPAGVEDGAAIKANTPAFWALAMMFVIGGEDEAGVYLRSQVAKYTALTLKGSSA